MILVLWGSGESENGFDWSDLRMFNPQVLAVVLNAQQYFLKY